ncbi:XRE family transcriptional regulator [Micromonospora sp. NPDC007230]|uniref:XRE family transcriptional regulator n=1 Tax=Micromonospora sp. NPDC007230 TaxID=3364237 RepID=UPI00367A2ABE
MVERSPFGVRLWRLLAYRRLLLETSIEDMAAALARDAGVPSLDLDAVIKGAEPSPELLRLLGPALGIRTADMFVIAGLPVPDELAPAGPTSPWDVREIIRTAVKMTPEQRRRLNESIRSLPVEHRTDPMPTDGYPEGPGALMLRLARNRNIRPWCAQILYEVGGGPYVSASTVAMLGPGKTVITPQYVTAFAHLLGYTPGDMVALAGVGPAVEDAQVHPACAEIAALAWDARRLTSDQIAHVVRATTTHSD